MLYGIREPSCASFAYGHTSYGNTLISKPMLSRFSHKSMLSQTEKRLINALVRAGPFTGMDLLPLIPAGIINHIHFAAWNEITSPLPNFMLFHNILHGLRWFYTCCHLLLYRNPRKLILNPTTLSSVVVICSWSPAWCAFASPTIYIVYS